MSDIEHARELENKIEQLQKNFLQLRLLVKGPDQVKDVSQFKKMRKEIARMKTKLNMLKKGIE